MAISSLELNNYKSIVSCNLDFQNLNIIIGANGAGKSCLLSFFELMRAFTFNQEGYLRTHVTRNGGPDAFLRYGRKCTQSLSAALTIADTPYRFSFELTKDDEFFFVEEMILDFKTNEWHHQSGRQESMLSNRPVFVPEAFVNEISQWRVYHINDTGSTSPIIKKQLIADNRYLRNDGSNITSFLYMLKERYPKNYRHIVKTVQRIVPFFSDFTFRQVGDLVELLWIEKASDIPLKVHLLSDGVLRFICLATLLLQPKDLMPQTIFIDEPELGLHPFALNVLAGLIRSVSADRQLIVATQSPEFLNAFTAEAIVVADRNNGQTTLKRLNSSELKLWLEKYTLSELWQMNYLEGGTI